MSASSKKKLRKERNAAALTEKQLQQQKEAKKLKSQTVTFVIIVALVLAIGIGSLAVTAFNNSGIAERNSIALTIGDHKLSAADLCYYYFDGIAANYNEIKNQYGEYASSYMAMLMGLDFTKPLDEQMYDKENNVTYADYFTENAVQAAVNTYAVYDAAVANGKTLDDAAKQSIDNTISSMKSGVVSMGYRNLKQYLKAYYGNGATEKSFRKYLETNHIADAYKEEVFNGMSYTVADLAAYNEEHFNDFSSFSYATFYVSVNDLVDCPADEDDKEHKHSQAEMDAALKTAEDVVAAIKKENPATAEELNKFIHTLDAYAENESASCIENKDKLYTSITDTEIAEWLVEDNRKAGDITVITNTTESTDEDGNKVTTPYSFNVVLYLGRNDNEMKMVNVRHILKAFTGGTTDAQGNTVYSEGSVQKAKEAIEKVQATWVDGGMGEDAFAQLALTESDDDGSALNGGLYEDVYPGQMVPAFNDWCFEEGRAAGDYGIVKTEYGYHLIYFAGHSNVTFRNFMIENTLHNTEFNEWYKEQVEAKAYTVLDTSKIPANVTILQ